MPPSADIRLAKIGNEQVADGEDQIAGAAIADRQLMRGAEPIEHRQADAIERHREPLGRLAAVRMRHQEVATLGAGFQILEVADQHLVAGHLLQQPARSWW